MSKKRRRRHPPARRAGRAHHYVTRSHSNPFRRGHRGHRHHGRGIINPFALNKRDIVHVAGGAATGALAAVGVDVALAYMTFLPTTFQTGWGRIAAQALTSVGLGYLAARVFKSPKIGVAFTGGGLTIASYLAIRQLGGPTIGQYVKGFSGLADFSDYQYAGQYAVGSGMGAYMRRPGMGAYMNPAAMLTSAATSPIRAKQMGAYMGMGHQGYSGYDSESM